MQPVLRACVPRTTKRADEGIHLQIKSGSFCGRVSAVCAGDMSRGLKRFKQARSTHLVS